MATYFARKAGNINATDVWATTPSGTASAVTFVAGDILMANSFAITVNVSTDLGSTGQVRNDTTGGATAGGSFTLSNGVTLTANAFAGGGIGCVTFSGVSPNTATLIGNCAGGAGGANARTVANTSTGTLNIVGNCTGGGPNAAAAGNISTGSLTITGNCTGGNSGDAHGAVNASTGTLTITGNCAAGSNSGAHGAHNQSTGTLTIIGPVSQGGNANLTGGTSTGAFGANNHGTGSMFITGPIYASEFDGGVGSGNRAGLNFLTGPFYTSAVWGVNPIRCVSWRWATNLVNTTFIEVPTANLAAKRNLVTPDNATNFPAPANVRSGITFGIGGALVGTCAVPLPAQVAPGVPIDNTIGTLPTPSAAEVATAVWTASTRTITGGTVDTLTNAPTVPSAEDIASEVRTELATELGRIDAIKTRLDSVNVERVNNTATTNIVGTLLAQANS